MQSRDGAGEERDVPAAIQVGCGRQPVFFTQAANKFVQYFIAVS